MSTGISVVIPSYNHARWIGEAIASVRAQSLPVDELVVVDDGSTDGSPELLRDLADERTVLEVTENRGAHAAINRAIERSGSEWIAILNSDDAWEPWHVEEAWGVASATGAALVCGEVSLIGEGGTPPPPDHDIVRWYAEARAAGRQARDAAGALRHHNVAVTTSNFVLHRSLFDALGGFRAWRYVHDYDFALRALALCPRRVVYEPSLRGVRYRVHGANTISEAYERALAERTRMLRTVRGPWGRLRAATSLGARRRIARAVERAGDLAPVRTGAPAPAASRGSRSATPVPCRVGLVARSLDPGGLEEVVALLAESLPAAGVEPTVFCTQAGGAVAERLRRSGVRVAVGNGEPAAAVAWARAEAVDVVSSHFAPVDVVGALAAAGLPVVETVHNAYVWLDAAGWARECERARIARRVVSVSEAAAAYWAVRTDRVPEPVVPNAVHPGRGARVPRAFARRRLGAAQEAPLVAAVGRVTRQKNPDGLLRAFAAVVEERPEATLLLVGPEDRTAPVSGLRTRHAALFRTGHVRWLGDRPDVNVVLSAADAFVSSSFYEGWSVAASEALWVGLPVVLADAGGASAMVGDAGERGILVPNPLGDPATAMEAGVESAASGAPDAVALASERALTEALVRVLDERNSWRARAPEVSAWARSALAPGTMAARYAEVLRGAAVRD